MKINNVSPVITNNSKQGQNNNVAFKGNFIDSAKTFLSDNVTLKRDGTMVKQLFIANAFVFLLGSRLFTSRDKKNKNKDENKNQGLFAKIDNYLRENNEKRETLIRDVPSIVIAVVGVPLFQGFVAKAMEKMTGFAFLKNPKDMIKETASYSQLNDWYKYDEHLASGFTGFCQRLNERGVNLKKIFSYLNDDIKKDLSTDEFKNIKDNAKLSNAIEANGDLKGKIIKALGEDNRAVKQASFLKSLSAIAGYAFTLTILGICIPKLNIAVTEKINKDKVANETKAEESNKKDSQTKDSSKSTQAFEANKSKKVFNKVAE